MIAAPSRDDTRSQYADFLELSALQSQRGRAGAAKLNGVIDMVDDNAEPPDRAASQISDIDEADEEILETLKDEIGISVLDELAYREKCLGDSYPFTIDFAAKMLERKTGELVLQPGQVTYLFCLLASAIREGRLQPANQFDEAEKEIASLFQVCACLAAGGYFGGDVASFGFPRASGTAFLPALRDAYTRMGAGEVRPTEDPTLDFLPNSLKDGGIDVIAWRDLPDRMPGKVYVLGQCASGKKWEDKSVVEFVPQLHGSWFTEPPAHFYLPAMFIPFPFHHDFDDGAYDFETKIQKMFSHAERRFGMVFDRLRIASMVEMLMKNNSSGRNVDGESKFADILDWVEKTAQITRESGNRA